MKQCTTPEQTAKLIELGFDVPNSIKKVTYIEQYGCGYEAAYSIGELIEMLPGYTDHFDTLHIEAYDSIGWDVWYGCYCNGDEVQVEYSAENKELIDALYDMVIKLKKEGVI